MCSLRLLIFSNSPANEMLPSDTHVSGSCQTCAGDLKKPPQNPPRTSETFQDSGPDPAGLTAPHLLPPSLESELAGRECALVAGPRVPRDLRSKHVPPSPCLQTALRFLHLPHSSEGCGTGRRSPPVGAASAALRWVGVRGGEAPGARTRDSPPPFLTRPRRVPTRPGEGHTFYGRDSRDEALRRHRLNGAAGGVCG